MSAETLRRAAKVLREHAAATAEHPAEVAWDVDSNGLHMDGTADYWLRPHRGRPALWMGGRARCGVPEFIALMHPPVALAMAEMLERLAPLAQYWHEPYAAPFVPIIESGMRLARAVLREEP